MQVALEHAAAVVAVVRRHDERGRAARAVHDELPEVLGRQERLPLRVVPGGVEPRRQYEGISSTSAGAPGAWVDDACSTRRS